MTSLEAVLSIVGGAGFLALGLGLPLLVLRLARARSRKALLPLAELRGWHEVRRDGESLLPSLSSWWKRLLSTQASACGTWRGLRAELATCQAYKNRDATMAVVECPRLSVAPGPVSAADRSDPLYRDYHLLTGETETVPAQASALVQRFRLSGQAGDVGAIFAPNIERAMLQFPAKLYSVAFHGRTASVVWLGYEKSPAIADAALDLAASICRQVEARAPYPGG